MELASCHCSGAWNFQVDPMIFGNCVNSTHSNFQVDPMIFGKFVNSVHTGPARRKYQHTGCMYVCMYIYIYIYQPHRRA